MKRILLEDMGRVMRSACVALALWTGTTAWAEIPPAIHVEGNRLVDEQGNKVVMHGVMDTPSCWFNSGRWGWMSYDDQNAPAKCVEYFEKLFTAITDSTQGAYCTVFRLHLDPCWTNTNSTTATGFSQKGDKWYDPHGQEVDGEANIVHFDKNRLSTFLSSVYVPIIKKALAHGLHVIVRPPGVFPRDVWVGDYYNDYLLTVWDIVSKKFVTDRNLKKYHGQLSIELGNEPINMKDASGLDNPTAMHDFFQPMVDKIRENGFTGIVWVPGKVWQQDYADYAKYPITGENIGYAVHCYTGWYGQSDENADGETFIKNFANSVPVVRTNPIVITEVDWSPSQPDLDGNGDYQYNPDGSLKTKNYGTWATGTTSKWGKAYKQMKDYYGNISMTLTSTDDLIDMDYYLKTKIVRPAFQEAMTANGIDPMEACGAACMKWYEEYAKAATHGEVSDEALTMVKLEVAEGKSEMEMMVGGNGYAELIATFADGHTEDVASMAQYTTDNTEILSFYNGLIMSRKAGVANVTATYTDAKGNEQSVTFGVSATYFPWSSDFISYIWDSGRYDEANRAFYPKAYGQMGWQYQSGADFSDYKYLVVNLDKSASASSADIRLYAQNSIWGGSSYAKKFGSAKQIVVPLQTITYTDGDRKGQAVDLKNIYIVAIWTNGNAAGVDFSDIYLTNNDDYSAETTGIATVMQQRPDEDAIYDLTGRRITQPKKGLYIKNGRKYIKK